MPSNSPPVNFNKKNVDYSAIFAAFSSLNGRGKKGEGSVANRLAKQFNVSKDYIHILKYIFENGDAEIINLVCSCNLTVKKAKKLIFEKKKAS